MEIPTEMKKIKHQVFKYEVPCNIFIDLLNEICEVNEGIYVFHEICFRRANFKENIVNHYLNILQKYYHASKIDYIKRGTTFKGLSTILRQLCKYYNIKFTSNVKYMFSKYSIIYNIFIDC